jgi:hypothetical protein
MNVNKTDTRRNLWHKLLGKIFEELLTPVNVTVETGFPIMAGSPEADVLLIRRNQPRWTEAQRSLLPDGIRDTQADHVLIEFKYSESVNKDVLFQALSYRYLYLKIQKLKPERLHTVIISSKTPSQQFRMDFGYQESDRPGVWHSNETMLDILHILVLNDLSDAPHNLFIKCFASRPKEKERSFKKLFESSWKKLNASLLQIFMGMRSIYASAQEGIDMMEYELTPEKVMEIGRGFEDAFLACLPIDKRLKGLKPEDIFARFKPEDIFARFKPEERIAGLKPEERIAGLKPEERIAGLKLEDILANSSAEDIMAYINKRGKDVR